MYTRCMMAFAIDGVEEGIKVMPEKVEIELLRREVQVLLNSENFRRAITANRLIDMSQHSGNIFQSFPDYSPPPTALKQLEVSTGGKYRFTDEQTRAFLEEMWKMGKIIRGAWMFAAGQDQKQQIHITAGHPTRYIPYGGSFDGDEVQTHSMRGMFIRLGEKYNGVYIVQLDSGKSRALYDSSSSEELFHRIIPILSDSSHNHYAGEYWLDNLDLKTPLLLITNENFQIEKVLEIKKYLQYDPDRIDST